MKILKRRTLKSGGRIRGFKFSRISTKITSNTPLHVIEEASKEYEFYHDDSEVTMMSEEDFTEVISMEGNAEHNKAGLKKLLGAVNTRSTDFCSVQETISRAVVSGGHDDQDQFRECIKHFICNSQRDHEESSFFLQSCCSLRSLDRVNDNVYLTETENEEEEQAKDELHLLSLKLIAASLDKILLLGDTSFSSLPEEDPINFHDTFWIKILGAVTWNIEISAGKKDEVTGYSLRILRLLHSLEPLAMKQLLQQSLMPYLIHLKGYGETQKVPLIESEATRLLRRGEIQETRWVSI